MATAGRTVSCQGVACRLTCLAWQTRPLQWLARSKASGNNHQNSIAIKISSSCGRGVPVPRPILDDNRSAAPEEQIAPTWSERFVEGRQDEEGRAVSSVRRSGPGGLRGSANGGTCWALVSSARPYGFDVPAAVAGGGAEGALKHAPANSSIESSVEGPLPSCETYSPTQALV